MKLLGINFAPLMIPLERRLQTFAVLYYSSYFLFVTPIACTLLLLYLFFFTKYYFITILYCLWFAYDFKKDCRGGHTVKMFRGCRLWKHFSDYFPVKMVKSVDLDPSKNYIFGYHPHGIMCFGAFACFGTEGRNFSGVFPGIKARGAALNGLFSFPIHREQLMAAGSCSVNKESIEWLLTNEGKGIAVILVVGGASEALNYHPEKEVLVLKKRKGFVKLALKHGASLVPVFAFGENAVFDQVKNPPGSLLRRFQEKFLYYAGFSLPLIKGRGIFQYDWGLLPHRRPITVVIGKPIDVEKVAEPTDEDIIILHEKYINSLTALFEEHKVKYAPDMTLTIE